MKFYPNKYLDLYLKGGVNIKTQVTAFTHSEVAQKGLTRRQEWQKQGQADTKKRLLVNVLTNPTRK